MARRTLDRGGLGWSLGSVSSCGVLVQDTLLSEYLSPRGCTNGYRPEREVTLQ